MVMVPFRSQISEESHPDFTGVFCRRFGVPLIDGGTVRLGAVVGLGRALDLVLTGRPVSAPEALAMGLATSIVDPGQVRWACI